MVLRALVNRAVTPRRIRGRRNSIVFRDAVLRGVRIEVYGDDNRVTIAPQASLRDVVIEVRGSGHRLEVGAHASIRNSGLHMFGSQGLLDIGARTTCYGAEFAVLGSTGRIMIGEDCLFSKEIHVRNGDSHTVIDLEGGKQINKPKDVRIGAHVWIGFRVLVLKGSDIGSGSVVGAGAVVTGPLPERCVAVGVPARPVRLNASWER